MSRRDARVAESTELTARFGARGARATGEAERCAGFQELYSNLVVLHAMVEWRILIRGQTNARKRMLRRRPRFTKEFAEVNAIIRRDYGDPMHLGSEGRAGLGARRPAQRERVALAEWMELLVGGHPLTYGDGRDLVGLCAVLRSVQN